MKTGRYIVLIFTLSLCCTAARAQSNRWQILSNGNICWSIDNRLPHADHIELSGKQVSAVLRYGVNADSSFHLERSMVWPLLRTLPNNTHASLMQRFSFDVPSMLTVNGRSLYNEKVQDIQINGMLCINSTFALPLPATRANAGKGPEACITLSRTLFPSTDQAMLCERYQLKNISNKPISVNIPKMRLMYHTDPMKGLEGEYTMLVSLQGQGLYTVAMGETISFDIFLQAFKSSETEIIPNGTQEQTQRAALVSEWRNELVLETPDTVLNTAFAYAKIRAAESIYATKGGPMHGPGGESYYAAIWANDQAEYINPFFPYLGYDYGNASALNAFRHFARFMNSEYKPIPSSIISEGTDSWNGAGDRGDAAMIAYGAARYALVRGSRSEAQELWPLIEWCLEYCHRQLTPQGVVASDSDELEGRFPSGSANLCTSSLYYDALLSSACLANDLGKTKTAKIWQKQAGAIKKAIEAYFGATVEGFKTYRYYKENDILRSWICIPLCMGIFDRKEGTIAALFSPRLWTKDGLLTQAGDQTFWDRSTLYALRGVLAAGATQKAMEYLSYYSRTRLLGEHVPYPIEAWPEGSQRHLSAESGLYCRIMTEGLFGIRPTGLRSFSLTPRLPEHWEQMSLKNIHAFGHVFDLFIQQKDGKTIALISAKGSIILQREINKGGTLHVKL